MAESGSKRKRPERQLYVPPAQRASRLLTKQCEKKVTDKVQDKSVKCQESLSDSCSSVLSLSDFVNLVYFFNALPCEFRSLSKICNQHHNCEFRKFLNFKKYDAALKAENFIKIYDNFVLLGNVWWRLSELQWAQSDRQFKSYPIYDLDYPQIAADKPPVSYNFNLFFY